MVFGDAQFGRAIVLPQRLEECRGGVSLASLFKVGCSQVGQPAMFSIKVLNVRWIQVELGGQQVAGLRVVAGHGEYQSPLPGRRDSATGGSMQARPTALAFLAGFSMLLGHCFSH